MTGEAFRLPRAEVENVRKDYLKPRTGKQEH
jgi:hypothetical protein